jgi:hypothetical protein
LQWHCQCGSSKAGKSKGYRVDRISCCLVPPYDVPIARFCGAMSSHSVLERLLLFVNMWLDLRFRWPTCYLCCHLLRDHVLPGCTVLNMLRKRKSVLCEIFSHVSHDEVYSGKRHSEMTAIVVPPDHVTVSEKKSFVLHLLYLTMYELELSDMWYIVHIAIFHRSSKKVMVHIQCTAFGIFNWSCTHSLTYAVPPQLILAHNLMRFWFYISPCSFRHSIHQSKKKKH